MKWVIAVLLGIVVWLLVRQKKASSASPGHTTNPSPQPEPVVDERTTSMFAILGQLNLDIRLENVGATIVTAVEAVIDHLTIVVPKLNLEHPTTEFAFTASQIGTSYLPNLMKTFLRLSPENRQLKSGDLLATLQELSLRLERTQVVVERGLVDEFEIEAEFLKERFPSSAR